MQTPEMNLKIEMFGNLLEELNYWHYVCDHEEGETEFEYAEQMFIESLSAIKELRDILLGELYEYRRNCETNHEPVDISYYRIQKQLQESTFSLLPNG